MATTFDIQLPHYSRGFHLITRDIVSQLPALPESGLLVVFIKHTSAGLTINENADPDVRHDFQTFFNKLVPDGAPYFIHTLEGPDDMSAHIKASPDRKLGHHPHQKPPFELRYMARRLPRRVSRRRRHP